MFLIDERETSRCQYRIKPWSMMRSTRPSYVLQNKYNGSEISLHKLYKNVKRWKWWVHLSYMVSKIWLQWLFSVIVLNILTSTTAKTMAIIPIILILLLRKSVRVETHPCLKATVTVHVVVALVQQLDISSVPFTTSVPVGPLRPQHSYCKQK